MSTQFRQKKFSFCKHFGDVFFSQHDTNESVKEKTETHIFSIKLCMHFCYHFARNVYTPLILKNIGGCTACSLVVNDNSLMLRYCVYLTVQ